MIEIGPQVLALAERIAEDAMADHDKSYRLDCFKALSQFFIGLTRLSRKQDVEDDDSVGMSMTEMRARVGTQMADAHVAAAARRAAGEVRERDRNGRFT